MKYAKTTAPTALAVTLSEVKDHLVVSHSDDDELITEKINQAVDYCEQYTGRFLMPQVWTVYLDGWFDVDLPFPPVQSVVVKYRDTDGAEQTLDAAEYQLDAFSAPPRIYFTGALPALSSGYNNVWVEVTAGYVDEVPPGIGAAILLIVGHLYNNRESTAPIEIKEVPMSAKAFLDLYKVCF